VGPRATAPCDLLLWGCGCTPLPHLSVKHLTLRLVRLQALDRSPTTYSPGQAVLPALWGHTASGTADPNAVQALAQRLSAVFLAKLAASKAAAGAFFFPRSLYTLGKAYACKARSECDSVWASAPGIGQPGSAAAAAARHCLRGHIRRPPYSLPLCTG
jgi:hypothetical protein